MKIKPPHQSNSRANWLKTPVGSGQFRSYLMDKGSLTRRLQLQSQHFAVTPLQLKQTKALHDEAILLALKQQQTALQRDVLLVCDGVATVFAHSVLPKRSLRGKWRALGRLGAKPLGATLFANPKVQRTPLSYKKLNSHHSLYQRISRYCVANDVSNHQGHQQIQNPKPRQALWARRSVFSLHHSNLGHAKILVTEVFLPALLK